MIILLVIISLSILILVHELGHFLTAKFFGVRVDEFGIGFPPRLFKKKMGDTTYSFNLLPFGGFVKIHGEDGETRSKTTNASESTNNTRIIEKALSYKLNGLFFRIQKNLGRYATERQYGDALENLLKERGLSYKRELPIAVEGRLSNRIDFLIEDTIVVELKSKPFIEKDDYFQVKRYLEASNLELGLIVNFRDKYLKPKRILNSELKKNQGIRVTSDHSDEFVVSDRYQSFASQPVWKRSVIVLAGIFMNVILGWLVLSIVFMLGAPEHLAIGAIAPDSPAQKANLKEGDIILAAKYSQEILGDPVKTDDFIALVKKAGDQAVEIKIQRGKEKIDVFLSGRINPPPGQGSLGVSLAEIGFERESFFKGFVKGFETTVLTFKLVAAGFLNLIAKIFVTPKVIETLTGPVGIFTIATQAGLLGGAYLLQLLAFISINLAVLNLIPFPALDGGRFLLLIIEKIKGSPISRRFQIIVNAAGFAALIVLMIMVTIQDLGRIF